MPHRATLISIAASIRDFLRVVGLKSPMGSGLGGGDATSLPQQPARMVINIAQVPN
jgi:hypothetical protein